MKAYVRIPFYVRPNQGVVLQLRWTGWSNYMYIDGTVHSMHSYLCIRNDVSSFNVLIDIFGEQIKNFVDILKFLCRCFYKWHVVAFSKGFSLSLSD